MADRLGDVEQARDAIACEAWSEAYDLLHALDPSRLTARDLEGLAEAAWWRSEVDEAIGARQRAYAAYVAEGDEPRAAAVAMRLCIDHALREEMSVAMGWLRRARSHLQGRAERVEHGYLEMVESTMAIRGGDLGAALERARRGRDIARRFRDPNAWAMATVHEGFATMALGRIDDGLGLLDEAMTAVVAGELTPYFTGAVYCIVVDACLEATDVRRAGEWSEAAREWCRSIPPESPYPGQCRVNLAEVARLRGEWSEAEAEAMRATDEMLRSDPRGAGAALSKVGEVRLRRGDLAGAEDAFAKAHELGSDPQPGLALLRLAQGKADAARMALDLALSDPSPSPARRVGLLAAKVEVALAGDDLEAARAASQEIDAIAETFPSTALHAAAATGRGSVALAAGSIDEALEDLRRARTLWQELRLPFEAARTRARYGRAVRAAGGEEDAVMELRAALATFERLGAAPDAAEVSALLGTPPALPGGLTRREAEVLRLVASGRTNRDIAVELVISEHTVARHLQNIFAKLGVSSRSAATAFAFEHGLA